MPPPSSAESSSFDATRDALAQKCVRRLIDLNHQIRQQVIDNRRPPSEMAGVERSDEADTIYAIDAVVEPAVEAVCEEWGKETPLLLIAEGILNEKGEEGGKTFPAGTKEEDCEIRVIVDPIDGTRGLMYDKRPAWALAAVAPNNGPNTMLRDCIASVMTELPTSKMGFADTLYATPGSGAKCERTDLRTGEVTTYEPRPSPVKQIDHGFAQVSDFFPGTKVLAGELMETIVAKLIGKADVTRATVFEDQYISTGGQWYELICGRDRFNADLRPEFYRLQGQLEGLCCHPYDCAGLLIAEEAGIILTDHKGQPLDGPLDLTTGISWMGYANESLREQIEPIILEFLSREAK